MRKERRIQMHCSHSNQKRQINPLQKGQSQAARERAQRAVRAVKNQKRKRRVKRRMQSKGPEKTIQMHRLGQNRGQSLQKRSSEPSKFQTTKMYPAKVRTLIPARRTR